MNKFENFCVICYSGIVKRARGGNNLKSRKVLKTITIILSIILLLLDICVYIKMKATWSELGSNNHQYENASLLIVGLFRYGVLIWGILLIPMVWLEYFLIKLFMKIYNNFHGLKRLILSFTTLAIILTILALIIKIILLIIKTLV